MIELSNVSFRYEGAETNVLTGISLTIKSGECVVLTGASGCGKLRLHGLSMDLFLISILAKCMAPLQLMVWTASVWSRTNWLKRSGLFSKILEHSF